MMIRKYFILFFLFSSLVTAHPYEKDAMLVYPSYLLLELHTSDAYKMQFDLCLRPSNGKGVYKNVYNTMFNIDYGFRINNENQIEHKIRGLLFEYNGIFYNTLLTYGEGRNDTLSGEYLFNHFGVKVLDWSNLGNFEEFDGLEISNQFTFENRSYHKYHLLGLPYEPNENNFYLIPKFTFAISQIDLTNNLFDLPDNIQTGPYFEIPFSVYLELGYEKRIEYVQYDTNGRRRSSYLIVNSINLFGQYKKYPIRNFDVIEYGVSININPGINYLSFLAKFKRSEINIDGFRNHNYNLSIEYFIPLYFLTNIFN